MIHHLRATPHDLRATPHPPRPTPYPPPAPRREAAQRVASAAGLATGRELAARSKPRGEVPLRRLTGRALTDFVEEALDAQAPLVIEYRQPTERRSTVRTIEPRGMEVRGGAYYLRAFCHLRQEERAFRLANIRGIARAVT